MVDDCRKLLDEYSRIFFARDKQAVSRAREIVEELKRRGTAVRDQGTAPSMGIWPPSEPRVGN
jgi:hypothetical protein